MPCALLLRECSSRELVVSKLLRNLSCAANWQREQLCLLTVSLEVSNNTSIMLCSALLSACRAAALRSGPRAVNAARHLLTRRSPLTTLRPERPFPYCTFARFPLDGRDCGHGQASLSTTANADAAAAWNTAWEKEVAGISYLEDHFASAAQLRNILKRGLLKFTDLRDEPARFFEAHRQIAARSTELGPGFFIRFTVQYNLFAGTILGCAGEDQLSILDDMQARGQLGCFALTEKFAGVNSGLVVETEIEWHADRRVFVLNTPSDGARKNWISQGFVADKAVVIANLTVGGQRVGPHAFTMDFRNDKGSSCLRVRVGPLLLFVFCVAHVDSRA
jgi:hypothetical protein